jgi:hypothetical protein
MVAVSFQVFVGRALPAIIVVPKLHLGTRGNKVVVC